MKRGGGDDETGLIMIKGALSLWIFWTASTKGPAKLKGVTKKSLLRGKKWAKKKAPKGFVPKIVVARTRKVLIPIKYRNCNFFSVS